MNSLFILFSKAQHSKLYLLVLNVILLRKIPFNKPHGLRILEVQADGFKIVLPYKRKNLNHIKSIHACALATLAEYASGLTLMKNLASSDYRIIMKNISMTYHYQAKTDVTVTLNLKKDWMDEHLINPLKNAASVFIDVKTDVFDIENNLVCSGLINWQVKKWEQVRTKVI